MRTTPPQVAGTQVVGTPDQSRSPSKQQRAPSRARFADEPAPQAADRREPDGARPAGRAGVSVHDGRHEGGGHVRENGWQTKHTSVADRIGSLFNCHTMSDITFHVGDVQIPAHRCVLGVTSPVFFHRLFEAPVKDDGGRCRIWKLTQFHGAAGRPKTSRSPDLSHTGSREERPDSPIYQPSRSDERIGSKDTTTAPPEATQQKPLEVVVEYPFDAFFELLRYIYKDELNITLDNVKTLSFLADDFNMPSLTEKCLDFLRNVVRPDTALRVLRVVKSLLLKSVVVLWRDTVEGSKILAKFKEFSLADRKKRMQELADKAGSRSGSAQASRVASRVGSRLGSRAGSRMGSRPDSRRSSVVSSDGGAYDAKTEDDTASAWDDVFMSQVQGKNSGDIFKLAEGGKAIHPCVAPTSLCKQLVEVGNALDKKSWKCIRERTDIVLGTPEFFEEDRSLVKHIFSLEMCSVSEIEMFRALLAWADHRCRRQGLSTLPEHRRNAAGSEFIELIRFPVMKAEEFQWEVVPSGILEYRDIQSIQRKTPFVSYSDEPRNSPPQEIAKQREAAREARRISLHSASPDFDLHGSESPDPAVSTTSKDSNKRAGSKVVAFGDDLDVDLPAPISRVSLQVPAAEAPRGSRPTYTHPDRRSSGGGLKAQGPKAKAPAHASPSYKRSEHLKGDDMDALISARMWRNHVDELVSQQRALEALDGLDGDPSKRMAFCAEPPDTGERPWSPPLPQASAERRGENGLGGLLPPASPAQRPSTAASRVKRRPKQEPTMVLQTPGPGPGGRADALQASPKKVGLDELEHLAHRFYRFRGGAVIEMRLEGGDPVVYEHRPPSSNSLGRTPTPEVQELLHGMREQEVRSSLGIRPPSTGSGVPLNDFLSGSI